MALLRPGPGDGDALHLLEGRRVLLALRGREADQAVVDWLHWHMRLHAVDGAVICDPGGAWDSAGLESAMGRLADEIELIVTEDVTCEAVRQRFLGRARSVAHLCIADLLDADGAGSAFDRAEAQAGAFVPLQGRVVYPWRLRQGRPARHWDHVAVTREAGEGVSSWCLAPGGDGGMWHWRGLDGVPVVDGSASGFVRAAGVARPGVPVGQLVRKGDLVEDPELAVRMMRAFGRQPVREQPGRRAKQRVAGDVGRVCVVTTMRNEGPFIVDWVAHQRVVGVGAFVVYTNDCDDGTEAVLEALSPAGVTRRDNPYRDEGGVPQYAAFRAAMGEDAVRDADWLLTLDVDEYLNIHAGDGRIADLLAAVPKAGAISMPWRLFGNADVHAYEDRPVVDQFGLAAAAHAPRPLQAWAVKTLFRNDGTFTQFGVHRPKGAAPERLDRLVWVGGSGRALPASVQRAGWRMTRETWGYDLVSVNHYAVRSAESFLVKRERGRANHVERDQGAAYWFRMNHNVVAEDSIRRLDEAVAEERARLMALPGVAEAHAASVARHRARIAALRGDADYAAIYSQITGPRLQKLSRLTPGFGWNVWAAGPDCVPDAVLSKAPGEPFYFNG